MMQFNLDRFIADLQEKQGNCSLRDMAKWTGVSASTLSRITRGKMPDIDNFVKLCNVLDLNPATYFQTDTEREYLEWFDHE